MAYNQQQLIFTVASSKRSNLTEVRVLYHPTCATLGSPRGGDDAESAQGRTLVSAAAQAYATQSGRALTGMRPLSPAAPPHGFDRPPSSTKRLRHLRWWIVWTLFGSTVINYISRQTFSVLAPVIARQFQLSHTDLSRIFSAFQISY